MYHDIGCMHFISSHMTSTLRHMVKCCALAEKSVHELRVDTGEGEVAPEHFYIARLRYPTE